MAAALADIGNSIFSALPLICVFILISSALKLSTILVNLRTKMI
jgi:hypothetical protein